MAFTDLGSLGAVGNTNNNQASLVLTTTAAVAVGDLAVVVVAVDNSQTTSAASTAISNVTNSGTANIWTKAIEWTASGGAAQAGSSCAIWYTKATAAMASGATITATFTTNTTSDASAMTARKFSVGAGMDVAIEGTPTNVTGSADPPLLDCATANIECLRIRGCGVQVGNNTNLTPTASWTAWANGNSATTGTTGEMCARAESRIATGTSFPSDPTYVSAVNVGIYVAFKETVPVINVTVPVTAPAMTASVGAATVEIPTLDAWNYGDKTATVALSNSDKTATHSGTGGVRATWWQLHGEAGTKYYAEAVYNTITGTFRFGLLDLASNHSGSSSNCAVNIDGNVLIGGFPAGNNLGAFANGDVACIAWDCGNKKVWFRKNGGLWDNTAGDNPATNTGGFSSTSAGGDENITLLSASFASGNVMTIRTELAEFTQAIPAGFISWMREVPVSVTVPVTAPAMTASMGTPTIVLTSPPKSDAWNIDDKSVNTVLSNNDKTATLSSGGGGARSTTTKVNGSAGKYYAEFIHTATTSFVGITPTSNTLSSINSNMYVGAAGGITTNGVAGPALSFFNNGDVCCVAWDAGAERIWFRRNNGSWNGSATANPVTGTEGIDVSFAAATPHALWMYGSSSAMSVGIRTELADYSYTVPAGFTSWMDETPPVSTADAWNINDKSANYTLSNNDQTATLTTSVTGGVHSTQKYLSGAAGKYYAEFVWNGGNVVGIHNVTLSSSHTDSSRGYYYAGGVGLIFSAGASSGVNIGSPVNGDVFSIAWDTGVKRIWFRKGTGNWNASATANPATGVEGIDISGSIQANDHALWATGGVSGQNTTVRTKLAQFTQTVPSGFSSWMGEAGAVNVTVNVTAPAMTASVGTVTAITTQNVIVPVSAEGMTASVGAVTILTPPAGGLWTPAEIAGDLIAWYDFADTATVIQSGGFLTQWNDKSGNNRHGVAGAATLAIQADGIYINNALAVPNSVIQMPTLPSAYFDVAFAGKPNPAGSYRTLIANKAGNWHHVLLETANNKLGTYNSTTGFIQPGTLEWPPVDGQLYFSGPDATSLKIGRDGESPLDEVGENFTPDSDPALLNYGTNGTQGWGTAREFVFMLASRSQDIRDKVSGYLAWKWDGILGVTTHVNALPAGHPYKNAAPTGGAVADVTVNVTAPGMTASVGTVTATGKATADVTTPTMTAAVGNVTVRADAIVPVNTPAMVALTGVAAGKGTANVTVTAPAMTAAVGTATGVIPKLVPVTAPASTASVGTITVSLPKMAPVTAPAMTSAVGVVTVSLPKQVSVTAPGMAASVGNVTVATAGNVTVNVTAPAMTALVGTVGVTQGTGVTVNVTTPASTASTGTPTFKTDQRFNVTAPASTAATGNVSITQGLGVTVNVTAPGMIASTGIPTFKTDQKFNVTSPTMTALIGGVSVSAGGSISVGVTAPAMTAATGTVTVKADKSISVPVATTGPWTPAALINVGAWLDATKALFTDGQSISSYTDHSSFARNFTAPAGHEPTFRANVNGKPRLEFAPLTPGSELTIPNYQPPATGLTYAILSRDLGPSNYGMWISYNGNTESYELRHEGVTYSTQVVANYAAGGAVFTSSLAAEIDTDYVRYVEFKPNAMTTLWVDGIECGSGASAVTMARPVSNLNIGSRTDGYYTNGQIGEVLVIDGVLTQADREKVEGYLAWKWGTQTALPAPHPYKSVAPLVNESMTVSVGTVTVLAIKNVTVQVTAPPMTALIGVVTVTGKANVSVAVPPMTAGTTNSTVRGDAKATVTAPASTAATGITSVTGKARADVTAPPMTAAVGVVSILAGGNIAVGVTAPPMTAAVGNVTVVARSNVTVNVTAPAMTAATGTPIILPQTNVSVTAPPMTAFVGEVSVFAGGNIAIPVTAPAMVAMTGVVTAKTEANISVSSPEILAYVGTLTFKLDQIIRVNAPAMTAFTGDVKVKAEGQGVDVWDGTTWTNKPAMVWTGSEWTRKSAKMWNGDEWV